MRRRRSGPFSVTKEIGGAHSRIPEFRSLGKSTLEIGEGTLIDYRLKLNGIPMRLAKQDRDWEPARRFVDTQVKGPYPYVVLRHEFIPLAHGH